LHFCKTATLLNVDPAELKSQVIGIARFYTIVQLAEMFGMPFAIPQSQATPFGHGVVVENVEGRIRPRSMPAFCQQHK
jgi:hypothetical protein